MSHGLDEVIEIDWTQLPHESARAFTVVCRFDRWPSTYELDALLQGLDAGFERNASSRNGQRIADTDGWKSVSYLGACGEVIAFDRATASARYVRVTFDIEEQMTDRGILQMTTMATLARALMTSLQVEVAAVPIDVEP